MKLVYLSLRTGDNSALGSNRLKANVVTFPNLFDDNNKCHVLFIYGEIGRAHDFVFCECLV